MLNRINVLQYCRVLLTPKFRAENERTNSTVPLNIISACVGCGVWRVWGVGYTVEKFKNSKKRRMKHSHTHGGTGGASDQCGFWEELKRLSAFSLQIFTETPRQAEGRGVTNVQMVTSVP